MKIAIDIDNTILECKSNLYKLISVVEKLVPTHNTKPNIIPNDEKAKNVKLVRNLFGRIGNPEYYKEIEGAGDAINNFCVEGHSVILLSSRPNVRTFNNVVLSWLEKNKINFDFMVVNCSDKAKFCEKYGVDLLIDDSIGKCVSTNDKGVSTILLDTKSKVDEDNSKLKNRDNFYIAHSWKDAEKLARKVNHKLQQIGFDSSEMGL